MNISILCVGKLKETWQRDACAEYLKRLRRYGQVEITEVPDQPEPAKNSEALIHKIVEQEGKALLKHVRDTDRVIALCIEGTAPDSLEFASDIAAWSMAGRRVVMIIGGSLGLSGEVLRRADVRLSFSRMTFPHQLMRVILLEQIYRAARINAGEKYHK